MQTDRPVTITNLVDCRFHSEQLAALHVGEWGHLYRPDVWNAEIARTEFMAMGNDVPLTLVATNTQTAELLGSVSLIATDDLDGFEQLTPWLASLYVLPDVRCEGIGRMLVDAVLAKAAQLNYARIYLFTSGQTEYYSSRGWSVVAHATAEGFPATVMSRSTRPNAARRALATNWISNPNFSGAYSYLRPGGTPDDRHRLTGQIHEGLWFAGEATSVQHPGTMHGAWFSGERAAAEVHAAFPAGRVVVVGAGASGLAAASWLRAHNHHLRIVDAEPRAGGRLQTDFSLGGPVHLGGAWMHGTDGHPFAESGLSTSVRQFGDIAFYVGEGVRIDGSTVEKAQATVEAALDLHCKERTEPCDLEAGLAAVDNVLHEAIGHEASKAGVRVEQMERALLCQFRGDYQNLFAGLPNDLSLEYRAEPYGLPGDDEMFTSPLSTIIDRLADECGVEVSSRVTAIDRADDHWSVSFDAHATVTCDAVIVTVPIGVLQTGRIAFDPPLPREVLQSIELVGAGAVCKVFFTFDSAFWAEPAGPAGPAWWTALDPAPLLQLWVDVSALTGKPTLCAFAPSSTAAQVEALTEHGLCELADQILRYAGIS